MAVEDEATSKKKVVKKEYSTAAATKPGMKTKVPAKRIPMSKARASTQVPLESEPKEAAAEGKKRKERVKKTTARVLGRSSIMRDSEVFFLLVLVAALGKLLGVLLLPSSELLDGLVPSLK